MESSTTSKTLKDDESKGKRILTLLMKYCFSHIGLFLLVAGYCVGGAYLFQHVEMQGVTDAISANANRSQQIEKERADLADRLWMYKWANDYNDTVDKLLTEYQTNISLAIVNNQYAGVAAQVTDFKNGWAFPSALLFTISIVTTIGKNDLILFTIIFRITVVLHN